MLEAEGGWRGGEASPGGEGGRLHPEGEWEGGSLSRYLSQTLVSYSPPGLYMCNRKQSQCVSECVCRGGRGTASAADSV